ncbi:hypothetical protein AURDEDRAFT_62926 [Auricularia subglabra TFB-10046 SS5]|nr:hypothetical protein AURDEDRAFT_62926 [Auricularia subglabra TFB-10046 SS5]
MLVAALLAFKAAGAAVTVPETEELVVISSEITPVGTLTYYGLAAGSANITNAVTSACGSNNLKCDGGHVPNANLCNNLIDSLSNDGGRSVAPSPRSICLSNGGTCCVSWHNVVPGLVQGHLVNAARDAYNGCVTHGFSGATDDTNLNGICTRQCLSNRPDGC